MGEGHSPGGWRRRSGVRDVCDGAHCWNAPCRCSQAASGSPPGQTNAYLTQITYPNTGVAHIEKFSYNYADGQLASSMDQNGNTTSYTYSDPLDRLTQINYPDGGQTQYSYSDSPSSVSVTTTKKINSGGNYVSVSLMDGVGHVVRTELTSDPAGADYTDTTYDGEGRAWTQSNPYRSKSDPSYGITTTAYDALGRATSVTRPDGNVASTSYSGNCMTATDEASKARETCSDGLGRMTQVVEDPSGLNYHTTYSYDALDNLTNITQGGQARSFVYDSLSRQLSATNPESGAKTYTYDANGNVATRTDARNITTTYRYDALNRLTQKSYSDGTPSANFYYDQASTGRWGSPALGNPRGRLTSMSTLGPGNALLTASVYSYDPMGRVTSYWQCTPYNCNASSIWNLHYNYDLAGDVTSWTHPAGFTITNSINAAQQITQIASSLVDANHPQYLAQNITHTPWGAESTLENGCAGSGCANTVETYAYNKRLQPVMIELGTPSNASADYCLVYNYYSSLGNATSCAIPSQGTGDNSDVMGYLYQNVNPSFSHAAAYQYDSLNRLTSAVATGNLTYNLAFSYDRFGNMTCQTNGQTQGLCPAYSINQANNRITNTGYSYDAAGDLTADSSHTYQWDAEGRFASEDGGATEVHTYNALGARARIISQGTPLDLFSDPAGKPLGTNGSYSVLWPLPGHAADVYYQGADAEFFHANGLGSTVMESNASGTVSEHLMFYPWGQLWDLAGGGGYNFASIPYRDVVSDLDLARFRDYSYGQGRWLSPDPDNAGADPSNPQSWNAYSYVGNNPTTNTDPSGLYCVKNNDGNLVDKGSAGESCADVLKSNAAEQKHPSVTVTAKPGNAIEAVATNAFLALDNAANDFFAPFIGMRPSYMQNTPTGSGFAANLGAAVGLVGTALIGPEGEAGEVTQGARDLLPFGEELSGRVDKAIEAAEAGIERFPKDAAEFRNDQGLLPREPRGYYKEYTVDPVGGVSGRGVERLVIGQRGEVYYTNYHYQSGTFVRIR